MVYCITALTEHKDAGGADQVRSPYLFAVYMHDTSSGIVSLLGPKYTTKS